MLLNQGARSGGTRGIRAVGGIRAVVGIRAAVGLRAAGRIRAVGETVAMCAAAVLVVVLPLSGCGLSPAHTPTVPDRPPGLRIELTVPATTPADSMVYVAGTFNGWNPRDSAFALRRMPDGRYAISLPSAVRGAIEFKFTLGAWETVELTRSGGDVANRGFTVPATGAATYTSAVARWRDGSAVAALPSTARPTVSIMDSAFRIPELGRTRRVWVYLPPDYATTTKRYPVLYMHDGQNVFDQATSFAGEWGVDETLDSLHTAGDHGAIVVAVDHGRTRRIDEYSPWVTARHGGGDGDEYVEFLVQTLKPHVDRVYRTRPDRLSTAVMGSSMGGLISLYAMLKHPEVFGRAGVFSPAFWIAPEVFVFARAARPVRPDPRLYFTVGGREAASSGGAATYVADQRRMVDTLAAAGFRRDAEVQAFVRNEGTHSEGFWRREFPSAYLWLFR